MAEKSSVFRQEAMTEIVQYRSARLYFGGVKILFVFATPCSAFCIWRSGTMNIFLLVVL
jgi:hypothetical protein